MSISSLVRKFTVLFALASLSLTVMQCSKDDDNNDPTPTVQVTGTWKVSGLYQKSGSSAETDLFPTYVALFPCFADIVVTFNANGNVSGNIPQACQAGVQTLLGGDVTTSKYELSGDQLTLTFSNNTKKTLTASLTDNKLSLIDASTSGGTTTTSRIVLTKQ